MLKSCKYCGRIHDSNYVCPLKPQHKYNTKDSTEDKFRSSDLWKRKREQIKQRDNFLCIACENMITGTEYKYNFKNLQVHHIISLRKDYDRRLDDSNLITLCTKHHKMAEDGEISISTLLQLADEQNKRR